MRLKYTEVKSYRQAQLLNQNQHCALCGDIILDDAVLDHDHKTGLIRKVLHRGCNALLGKIENNLARNKINQGRLIKFTENLVNYIQVTHTEILHPTFKEKKMGYGKGKGGKKPPKR